MLGMRSDQTTPQAREVLDAVGWGGSCASDNHL